MFACVKQCGSLWFVFGVLRVYCSFLPFFGSRADTMISYRSIQAGLFVVWSLEREFNELSWMPLLQQATCTHWEFVFRCDGCYNLIVSIFILIINNQLERLLPSLNDIICSKYGLYSMFGYDEVNSSMWDWLYWMHESRNTWESYCSLCCIISAVWCECELSPAATTTTNEMSISKIINYYSMNHLNHWCLSYLMNLASR